MNENMSMTAEVSAFVWAYHTAEGGEICNDPLAVKLLGVGRFGQIAAQMTAGREWFLPGDTGTQEEALRRIVNQNWALRCWRGRPGGSRSCVGN
mgnify:CR=1 FL=1